MKLKIKTLSPIHIGNGEKYNGLSYVEDISSTPKKVFIVDFDKIKRLLNQKDLEAFIDWVVSEEHPSWFKFCKFKLNKPQLQNEFKKAAIYMLHNYSTERFLKDIDCFIKQSNKPYIPGTEIKGAIRTAVAYNLLQNNDQWNWLKDNLIRFQNKFPSSFSILATDSKKGKDFLTMAELKKISKNELISLFGEKRAEEIVQKIQKGIDPKIKIIVNKIKESLVKEAGKIEEDLQNILFRANGKDDAKYDLLKLLHISDTELKKPSECLFVSNLEVKGINRGFPLFQELCKKDQTFTCDLMIENNPAILEKLGFSPEQIWVVSSIRNIFQCCYEFSNRLLDEEVAYAHYPQAVKDKLKIIKQQNKVESPVIRIGKNEGYLSLTMGLLVKDKDKTLYDNILCHATKNTSYTGNFPKTRRVVNLGNGDVDTCGWVKLELIP